MRAFISTSSSAPVLGFDAWARIDKLEVERGAAVGKVREKLIDTKEMLAMAAA